ncbi:MAG: phosphatase PAP2 family protein [Proteobacteria bacterium]|nr:phosphatase PAP2 family protein [Pseudomonadota bacterium]
MLALIFTVFPELDLKASSIFLDPGTGRWLASEQPWAEAFRQALSLAAALVPAAAIALFFYARRTRRRLPGGDGRIALYLILCLALGPGLLVNVVLKEHWGRARPSQIAEFGHDRRFTPALLPANECSHNCSFVSGEVSLGFSFMALGWIAVGRLRPLLLAAAATLGLAMGALRMAQGGHFLSDVLFAGLFTSFLCWWLHHWMFVSGGPARLARLLGR